MHKITVHNMNSVSEYCLDQDETITEKNIYQTMKQSFTNTKRIILDIVQF